MPPDVAMSDAASRLHESGAQTALGIQSTLDLTFFVSCYNEADYIEITLDTIREAGHEVGLSFEIVVIDDGSKDESRDIVRAYIAAHPTENVTLVANRVNRGLAQNYVDGAFYGRGKYYRLICGDNSEPRESIVAILKLLGQADCIVPYYDVTEGRTPQRRLVSRTYTFIVNKITGNDIRYYNGLAVHLRHNVMRWHTNTKGFGFQAEILCLLLDMGFTYKQIGVKAHNNRQGKSSALTTRNLFSVAHTILEIIFRRIARIVYR
jgi:glycosyltransferase involved in cell wall biosynthesis